MTSAVCHRFVQNAWRKERCSNCFKSREEHARRDAATAAAFQRRSAAAATPSKRGIMRGGTAGKRKRAVSFKTELTEIIGFGGEDWSDEVEPEDEGEDSVENSEEDSSQSESDVEKLTKSNTEHNANITVNNTTTERRRTFTQLMLGQPQKDSDGKKQTLLVSVTPFGQEESDKTPLKRFAKTVSHIPIARNKEILVEAKPKVILTSYSKNREFSENGKSGERKLADRDKDERIGKAEDRLSKVDNNKSEKKSHDDRVLKTETLKAVDRKKDERMIKTKAELEKKLIKQEKLEETEVIQNKTTALEEQKNPKSEETIEKQGDVGGAEKLQEINENVQKSVEEIVEEVMKTELNVKLSTPAPRQAPQPSTPAPSSEHSDPDTSGESSEDSTDSLVCVAAGSREQAGEPDGRADPDTPPHCVCEPAPALPLQPPPPSVTTAASSASTASSEKEKQQYQSPQARSSFLHGSPVGLINENSVDKPKIPSKPDKPPQQTPKKLIETQPSVPPSLLSPPLISSPPPLISSPLQHQDLSKTPNKRRAPNPPPNLPESPEQSEHITTEINGSETMKIYQEQEVLTPKPPPREIEASEILALEAKMIGLEAKIISADAKMVGGDARIIPIDVKMATSVSSDSLALGEKTEEKRKEKTKGRFSLKKFLRVGGNGSSKNGEKRLEEVVREKLKPRLVIVHPLELNGAGVEVMPAGGVALEEQRDIQKRIIQVLPTRNEFTKISEIIPPAPPPRNLSQKVDDLKHLTPPPKSEDFILRRNQQQQIAATPSQPSATSTFSSTSTSDSLYANLGEIRSSLPPPSKPQRTASMREREAQLERENQMEEERRSNNLRRVEHVYERLSPRRRNGVEENNVREGGTGSNRCVSSQSGSEDLEVYSGSSGYFTNGECELSDGVCPSNRPSCQLRSRKGRSVVHRNLEDNYGAVVVANHEALAQVLEHLVQQPPTIPTTLRPLHHTSTLRWSDFSVLDGCICTLGRRRAFHRALWAGAHRVTLAVSGGARAAVRRPASAPVGVFTLSPITVFDDLVSTRFLPGYHAGDANGKTEEMVQATVAVLPWMQVDTIQSVGVQLRSRGGVEATREACLILLQLVHSLKGVQAQGVEETPLSLTHIVLCHDPERDTQHRLCLLHGLSEEFSRNDESEVLCSLCQCATVAVDELFPPGKLAMLIRSLLKKESAISLSQVKSILEFFLWGPSDVALGVPLKDRELALQRWLDLERATVLHGLVGTRIQLTVLEECHLLFLVRSSAKVMCEASVLLEANS